MIFSPAPHAGCGTMVQNEIAAKRRSVHCGGGTEVVYPWCREPVPQSDQGDLEHRGLLPPSVSTWRRAPLERSPSAPQGRMAG